jgi:hypothetical protein
LYTIRPDCKTHSLLFLLNKGFNFPALFQLQHRKPHNAKNQCYKAATAGEEKKKKKTEQGNQKIARDSKRKTAKKEETTTQSGSKSRT